MLRLPGKIGLTAGKHSLSLLAIILPPKLYQLQENPVTVEKKLCQLATKEEKPSPHYLYIRFLPKIVPTLATRLTILQKLFQLWLPDHDNSEKIVPTMATRLTILLQKLSDCR